MEGEIIAVPLADVAKRISAAKDDRYKSPIHHFLQYLKMAVARIVSHRPMPTVDVDAIQSVLADDFSLFRVVNVRSEKVSEFNVQAIDNPHLHREIVDRTFELTSAAAFA